ncbi:ABC-F family ATP-binding cassette domain-containing protein [Megamonas hypermegale]|uniref:ABC-F family ATP-binding cassette domain-containing protein n=1 Tax=Megamonas hypermegale TaxID=158847 RepID=UPI00195F06DD|nr:ABC-F family ATP-binding cassette domain-containing protein [Megamonas hypermegale]MBM6834024.1 ABC-F family ATP-binding cassette domain-containing protein [Megamonas hypermegale]
MILTIENLCKTYGEKVLFNNVNFSLSDGDKVGIVGVNGTGKSTFIKVIAGIVPKDSGTITTGKNTKISYLEQDKVFEPEHTVLMEVFKGTQPLMRALYDYELTLQASQKNPQDMDLQKKIITLSSKIDELNGWQLESDAKTILTKLGIMDFSAKTKTLSGGQQKRLALATALIQPCDLLLLDEPTNHLDSETIAWLEEYLRKLKTALIMVTHDRYFLDSVATKILELDKGNSYIYTGNYTQFLELKNQRLEREEASEQKRQNFLRNELKWIRRGAQARSTKQRARIQRFEEVKNQKVNIDHSKIEIGMATSRLGRTVIELENVNYAVDDKTIIKDFTYTVLRNDRIGILGPNGSGKTTLLNIIAGKLTPTSGTVTIGQTVKIGYFTQKNIAMDERLRPIEYIKEEANYLTLADGTKLSASQLMERFLFPGTLQWTPIAKLSGGEKRRLYLLRILMSAPNVLLLDEPTNDLDLETMSILEEFIDNFNGAIIFVSHDRFFIDRLADKVFVYQKDGSLRQYPGGYSYYKGIEEQEQQTMQAQTQQSMPKKETKPTKTREKANAPKKLSFKEQREYDEIEAVIAETEGELKVVQLQMAQNASDYGKLNELTKEETRLQEKLDYLMERWAYLEEIVEQMQ